MAKRKSKTVSAPMSIQGGSDYQAMSDVDAMQQVQEARSNPKRHAKAKAHAKKKLKEHDQKRKTLASIAIGKHLAGSM